MKRFKGTWFYTLVIWLPWFIWTEARRKRQTVTVTYKCKRCAGAGVIWVDDGYDLGYGFLQEYSEPCPVCHGSGNGSTRKVEY